MSAESDKYEVLEKIGHGSFGVIRKVRRKTDGMVLCRKEISYLKMSQKEREQLHAEFQILSTLRHPNIVGYYHREHLKASQDLHLYMEYCGNGDLGRVIKDLVTKNQYAEESFVWSIFSQLVTALYRCHYGVDPPEVGKSVLGLGKTAHPKAPTGGMTIIHRDLKPENVFLGEDNSVKLGDFGLSKMIQSHDFASTYVGTPFYMSPEICAAEKYTLKSDIWSLGCIIYELCSREPPFNAKSHFQLVQRIKEGKVAPLPKVYTSELDSVIKQCLQVNPDRRPDTAYLLNMPVVRLMRKEREVVEFSKILKTKEESLNRRLRELDGKIAAADANKAAMQEELDASLRREWEVKARLEIDRQAQQERLRLQGKFEEEVQARVEAEVQRVREEMEMQQQLQELDLSKRVTFRRSRSSHRSRSGQHSRERSRNRSIGEGADFASSVSKSDYPHSSIGAGSAGDGDFPSSTDLTELSMDSPAAPASEEPAFGPRKAARTPFARAQTMFAGHGAGHGTPMDVEMASPSPVVISSLSLSPRRNAATTKAPMIHTNNIFAANQAFGTAREISPLLEVSSDEEDGDDDELTPPSPTLPKFRSNKNPFSKEGRPTLPHLQTAPGGVRLQLQSKKGALDKTKALKTTTLPPPTITAVSSNPELQCHAIRASPSRQLSKIPSAAKLLSGNATSTGSSGSDTGTGGAPTLTRKPSISKKIGMVSESEPTQQPPKLVGGNVKSVANIKGRNLVELHQARAGGRPMSAQLLGDGVNVQASPKRAFREHVAAGNRGGLDAAAVWDPDRDEMPSPFLIKQRKQAWRV